MVAILSMTSLLLVCSPQEAISQRKASFWKNVKAKPTKQKEFRMPKPKIDRDDGSWKGSRLEYLGSLGACGFLGDLGGQDGVGKPFIYDYEPSQTRYAISLGARYFLLKNHALRFTLSYARVRGADALTEYPNRKYRNLNFKSPIVELAAVYEFHFLKPEYVPFAGAATTKVFRGLRLGAYAYGGVGVFAFNPKGQRNGEWYALKPLNTEGQGLPGGPDPYRRVNFSVPLGLGVYYLLDRNWKVGLDFGYRWTTTDYIDDAGSRFYDNDEIRENYGELAAYFANPSVALSDVPDEQWYIETQPRAGEEANDTYMFLQVSISKSLGVAYSNREFKQQKRKKPKTYKADRKKRKKGKRRFKFLRLIFKSKAQRKARF